MIRFYKLYSLFLKTMDYDTNKTVTEWCLCEKLPRAVLHIPLDCNLRCEVCGLERRAKTDPSSSDEEEYAANLRQKMLLERRRVEEALQSGVRVKVAKRAKKPCSTHNCKKNCTKCGGMAKPRAEKEPLAGERKKKVYSGRFGHFPKPKGVLPKWRLGIQTSDRDENPTAPPPSSPSSLQSLQLAFESMWEPLPMSPMLPFDMSREVFTQPCQSARRHGATYGKRLFSDYIPLKTPITDPSGGAVSKSLQSKSFMSRLRAGTSRPLPPLSKVVASIMAEQGQGAGKGREKGGGLGHGSIEAENQMESQFCPFDYYEGPSEDALAVDSARTMLQSPMALNTKTDRHLPPLLLTSSDSEEGVISVCPKPSDAQIDMKPASLIRDEITQVTSSDGSNSKDTSGICKNSPCSNVQPIPPKTFNFLDFEEIEVKAEKKTDHLVKQTFEMCILDQVEQMMKALRLSSLEHDEDCAAENGELESESESKGSTTPPIKDVSNERVISSNKSQTDAKYSKVLSKQLNRAHDLHEPADRVCRVAGMKREGAKPIASGMAPVRNSKLGAESASSVCEKCGHHRNAGDAAMPNKDSKAKSVKQTPRKEPKEIVGPYRSTSKNAMAAEAHTSTSKKICRLSKKLVGKQPAVSLRIPDKTGKLYRTFHCCPRTTLAKQKFKREGLKPTCTKEMKEDKPDSLVSNHSNTPMKSDEESSKKSPSSMYKEPSSSSQTVPDPVSKAASEQRQLRNISSEGSNLEGGFHKTPDAYLPTDGRTVQPHMLSNSCLETEVSIHWRRIHTLETVSHVCGEMLQPKMARHRGNVMENLKKITLSNQPATSIYEFRLPDIVSNAIEKSGMANPPLNISTTHRRNEDVNKSGSETPVAHSPTPRHMDLFLRKRMRRPSTPNCPVPSIKYIRRKIRTQEGLRQHAVSEISFMRNSESLVQHKESPGVVHHDEKRMTPFWYGNIPSKANHLEVKLGRRIRREHSLERRFNMLVKPKSNPPETKSEQEKRREYLLKVKLEEMTTKPIQLLTPHEET